MHLRLRPHYPHGIRTPAGGAAFGIRSIGYFGVFVPGLPLLGHFGHALFPYAGSRSDRGRTGYLDILYKGMIADDEHVIRRKITIVKRLRRFISAQMQRDELETVILPLGDGVTVAVKK